jgi:hypothetical protein
MRSMKGWLEEKTKFSATYFDPLREEKVKLIHQKQ